eukprot:5193630-Heterocapsa_arctica.AAC.2
MGHNVQTSGDYEYCLGCGREAKAKHTTKRKHDIIFDGCWACQGCLARGPGLNNRDCINPTRNNVDDPDDDDRHIHKIRRIYPVLEGEFSNLHDDKELRTGVITNKQARKRAEEQQDEVNDNKQINNIEAHQKNNILYIPIAEVIMNNEITDEQTNNSFFNGKEVRKKAMLKAQRIQMHKRAKTTKSRLGKVMIDKGEAEDLDGNGISDKHGTKDNSEVVKSIKTFQIIIDEKDERDRNKETLRINKMKNMEIREK